MAITITDTSMISDQAPVSAEWRQHTAADGNGAWVVSWIPERLLDRNQAITAMTLAEEIAAGVGDGGVPSQRWPFIEDWAAELSLSTDEAMRRVLAALPEPNQA